MNDFNYVIRRRHIAADSGDSASDTAYLGEDGRWYTNIEQARKFDSLPAVEAALQETWGRQRNAGERSAILSVVKTPTREDEQVSGTNGN